MCQGGASEGYWVSGEEDRCSTSCPAVVVLGEAEEMGE